MIIPTPHITVKELEAMSLDDLCDLLMEAQNATGALENLIRRIEAQIGKLE